MKSPFKPFDPYLFDDYDQFFGMERETEEVYDCAKRGNIILVYGLAGVGKTSLIQCGLANKFDFMDWYPLFIRRGKDINASLCQIINVSLEETAEEVNIVETIKQLAIKKLRPIYLVFDQLEELFIGGMKEEIDLFISTTSSIIESNAYCKIILIIREEFLGYLHGIEKRIPALYRYQVRVKPLTVSNAYEIIKNFCHLSNIAFENEEKNIMQIIDQIHEGRVSGISLSWLQIYMDNLYSVALQSEYQHTDLGKTHNSIIITDELIYSQGSISYVLDSSCERIIFELQNFLEISFTDIPKNAVFEVIKAFITFKGDKQQLKYQINENGTLVFPNSFDYTRISSEIIWIIIEELKNKRILLLKEDYVELSHDSIAMFIYKRMSQEDMEERQIHIRVNNSYQEWLLNGELLNRRLLMAIDSTQFKFSPEIQHFIQESRKNIEKIDKNMVQEFKQFRRTRLIALILLIFLLISLGANFFFIKYQ